MAKSYLGLVNVQGKFKMMIFTINDVWKQGAEMGAMRAVIINIYCLFGSGARREIGQHFCICIAKRRSVHVCV